jgi:anti-anti-sigma regulatory factor
MFKVKVSDEGTVRTLVLEGRLLLGDSLTTLDKVVMATLTEGHKRIVFDFTKTGAIDSAGIGALAIYRKRAAEHQASIKVVIPKRSPIPSHVQTPIRLLYDTHEEVASAVVSF